jgi:ceroid-lipofuscinosis MFS transporter 7
MGLFTGAGCVSRIFGPLAVGSIYTRFGTTWTFTVTCGMMFLPMIWLYLFRDRLHVEEVDVKTIEMMNLNGNGTIKAQNGELNGTLTNGYIKVDKAVIINENFGEEADQFLSNGHASA